MDCVACVCDSRRRSPVQFGNGKLAEIFFCPEDMTSYSLKGWFRNAQYGDFGIDVKDILLDPENFPVRKRIVRCPLPPTSPYIYISTAT